MSGSPLIPVVKFVVFSFYPSILYPGLKDNPFSKLSPLAQRGKFWTSHPSFYVRVRYRMPCGSPGWGGTGAEPHKLYLLFAVYHKGELAIVNSQRLRTGG